MSGLEAAESPGPGLTGVQERSWTQSRFPVEVTGDPGGDTSPPQLRLIRWTLYKRLPCLLKAPLAPPGALWTTKLLPRGPFGVTSTVSDWWLDPVGGPG